MKGSLGRERENEHVSLAMDAQKRNGTKERDHETVMRRPEGGRKWRGRRSVVDVHAFARSSRQASSLHNAKEVNARKLSIDPN